MSGSVDDLIQFLLDEIAISGQQGRTVVELLGFVEQFYQDLHDKRISPQDKNESTPSISSPKVDRKLLERVWRWLVQHPDVRVGKDGKGKLLSLSEAEQHRSAATSPQPTEGLDASSQPLVTNTSEESFVTASTLQRPVQSQQTGSDQDLRVFVAEDRMWQAICGHPKDLTKVFEMEFGLLSVIATHRENGIVQIDLIRQSGQDKRSVPKRTDALQRKGYIEKRQVFVRGNRTSRLILSAFSSPNPNKVVTKPTATVDCPTTDEKETVAIDVDNLVRDIFAILREKTIVTQSDLRTRLRLNTTNQPRILVKAVRKLEVIGCLKRVMAASDTANREDALFMSVKYVRDPTQEDLRAFRSALRNLSGHPVGEEQDAEDERGDAPGVEDGTQLQEIDRIEPSWNPDRVFVNMLQDVIHRKGFQGCSIKEVRACCVGPFLRRPIENLLTKITRAPLSTQPPSLRHLAIIRDTILSGATALYIQYSLHSFQARVDAGKAFWEAVATTTVEEKKRARKKTSPKSITENSQDIDEFGFPAGYSPVAQFKGARGTIGQSMLGCQAEDLSFSIRDPRLRTNKSGNYWIDYNTGRTDKVLLETRTDIIPDDDPEPPPETPPRRQMPKEPTNPLQFDKPKGRPRKYVRGTEKFWREQFTLAETNIKRKKPKGRMSGAIRLIDPNAIPLYANRPPQFDDTLVRAAENDLPVPDVPEAITQDWVDATLSVLHRSTAGSYITPKGVKIKTLGAKNIVSQILVIRSPRLLERDVSKRKGTSFVRFLVSSAAHTLTLPGPQFSKDLAQHLEDSKQLPADPVETNPGQPNDVNQNDNPSATHLIGIRAGLAASELELKRSLSRKSGRKQKRKLDASELVRNVDESTIVNGRKRSAKAGAPSGHPKSGQAISSTATHQAGAESEAGLSLPEAAVHVKYTSSSRGPLPALLESAPEDDADQSDDHNTSRLQDMPIDSIADSSTARPPSVSEKDYLSPADHMGERDLEAYKLVQELSADVDNEMIKSGGLVQSADAGQTNSTHPSPADVPSDLPELVISDVESRPHQPGKDGLRTGSVGVLRRKIFLDLVQGAGGVLPAYTTFLTGAYTAAWRNAGQSGKPDTRTMQNALKPLCQSGSIKKIKFSHRNKKGLMVTKEILALQEISTSDPQILDIQQKMIDADPSPYVPAGLVIMSKERNDAETPSHLRWSSVIDAQKVDTSPAENLRLQLRETLKRAREEQHSEGGTTAIGPVQISRPRQKRLMKLRKQTSQPAKPKPIRTHSIEKSVPSQNDSSVIWKVAENETVWPKSVEDILHKVRRRKRQRFLHQGRTFKDFTWDANGIAQWEQEKQALFDTTSTDWIFINLFTGDDYRSSLDPGLELVFDGLIWYDEKGREHTDKSFHPSPPAADAKEPPPTSSGSGHGSIGQKFTNTITRRRKRRRKEGDEGGGDEPKKRPRRVTPPSAQPQTIVDLSGNVIDVSHLIGSKFKRQRGPQFLRNMPVEFKRKIIAAVVVVQTLAGGLEKFIYWDLVNRIFPEHDEEGLKARWKTISTAHRRDVKFYLEDFQEHFPEAYERGEIGNIDFDDLEAVDWERIVDWAIDNLGNPVRGRKSELPETKEELNQSVNLKFEVTSRPYREMFLYGQAITVPMIETAVSGIPFSVPIDSCRSSSVSFHRPNSETADDATSQLAKSWVLSSISTPRSAFNSEIAHKKLQTLATTPDKSEGLLDSALRSMISGKVITKVREDHKEEEKGRRYALSRNFLDNLNDRRTINAEILKQASQFKTEALDPAFQLNEKVRFDPTAIEDGHMMVILNLVGHNRIRLRVGDDVPRNRWGPRLRSKYKTRTVEMSALYFTVLIEQIPERYIFGNPLNLTTNNRSSPPQAPSLGTAERDLLPLWREIHGGLNKPYFALVVAAVLGILDARPGASTAEVAMMLSPALSNWEVEAMFQWGLGLGIVKKIGSVNVDENGERQSGSWTGGWELEEWWWMVLATEFEWTPGD